MSIGVPPRQIPVFDPVTGRVVGYELNPAFMDFFTNPDGSLGNPAGLGSPDPMTGEPVRPFTDPGVPTGVLFDETDFPDYADYEAARAMLVPDFYRDPITGELDPARAAMIDYRGRPAQMFNQGMEGVALQSWAMNNPEAAAELYWMMTPEGLSHLSPGEQRIIAMAVGPDLIEQARQQALSEAMGPERPDDKSYNDVDSLGAPPAAPLPPNPLGEAPGGGGAVAPPPLDERDQQWLDDLENSPTPRPPVPTDIPPMGPDEPGMLVVPLNMPPPSPGYVAPPPQQEYIGPEVPIVVGPGEGVPPQAAIPGQDMLAPGPPPIPGMVWDSLNGVWVWPGQYENPFVPPGAADLPPSPPITGGPY